MPPDRQAASSSQSDVVKFTRARPVRVLIVDDHPVVRKGLSRCLAGHKHLLVVGEAEDGQEALAKAKALLPDVVMMDVEMPKLDGLAATEVLHRENPSIKVLILSMHKHAEYVLRITRAGAQGYVSKEASPAELVQAIETVGAGGSFFGSEVATITLNELVKSHEDTLRRVQITVRERQVLVAIVEGLSNKEIAARLGVGVRTIETHRERLMRKLNIHGIAGLTKFAVSEGLVSLPQGSADVSLGHGEGKRRPIQG